MLQFSLFHLIKLNRFSGHTKNEHGGTSLGGICLMKVLIQPIRRAGRRYIRKQEDGIHLQVRLLYAI